jgi:two-component system, NarL family, invasion response regulator UvrY
MNILLVDDHAIVRAGLRRLLAALPADIAECASGQEALALVQAAAPDLILLDLNLPGIGGIELLRRLLRDHPGLSVLVLSMHTEPLYAARALDAGAKGYISKNASPEELLVAVRRVARGGRYVEAEIAQELAVQPTAPGNPLAALSERELEILRLLARGRSLAEIGEGLSVSYKTVANTCTAIKGKLGVARTADLLRLAIGLGLGG